MTPRKPVPSRSEPFGFWIDLVAHPERDRTGYRFFEDAASFPFDGGATGFSKVNAAWLADAALLSYFPDPKAVEAYRGAGLTCVPLSVGATQCHLAFNDDFAIVAFRGTQSAELPDVFDDARFLMVPWTLGQSQGHVHNGFRDAFQRIQEPLDNALKQRAPGRKLWMTGHSLGGALATLAADTFPDTQGVYTFGSPLVGDQIFAAHFDQRVSGRSFRYVDDHDVVTHVPPEPSGLPIGKYSHVDERRWIDKDGNISTAPPTLEHFVRDVFGRPSVLFHTIQILLSGQQLPMLDALADHAPVLYATHTWNAV